MNEFLKQWAKVGLRYLLILFYAFAGINHFINPQFYIPLIPPYFPFPEEINIISGIAEVALALGVAFPKTRKISIFLIIAMLIAFIPSHVYFIQIGGCTGVEGSLCTPLWVAWVRLVIVHPLLMWWAWVVLELRFLDHRGSDCI